MKDEKDLKLVNIYIRIHNRQALTMDDLAYLAWYNPDCFKKTCDNLIYKMPEAKPLVKPPCELVVAKKNPYAVSQPAGNPFEVTAEERMRNERMVRHFIESLKKIESEEICELQSVDVTQVKELVGNLFMKNLFPHNGLQGYFDTMEEEPGSKFNKRV